MIDGTTRLIPHIGWPTTSFKAPLIYNPHFAAQRIAAAVVPVALKASAFEATFRPLMAIDNVLGALITMPHKVTVVRLLDSISRSVEMSGSCNAVVKRPDGSLAGDNFDGLGFVRSASAALGSLAGARALVVGAGGVGSAIVAALADAGVARLDVSDVDTASAGRLVAGVTRHFPDVDVRLGAPDPTGCDLAVNATALGMRPGDPLPFATEALAPSTYVADVVMSQHVTPLLREASLRGCRIQHGIDMLFEMIPAYFDFFGLPSTTAAQLRATADLTF